MRVEDETSSVATLTMNASMVIITDAPSPLSLSPTLTSTCSDCPHPRFALSVAGGAPSKVYAYWSDCV